MKTMTDGTIAEYRDAGFIVGFGVLNCSQVPNISLGRYCVSLILPV
jgi:hypothetical protein